MELAPADIRNAAQKALAGQALMNYEREVLKRAGLTEAAAQRRWLAENKRDASHRTLADTCCACGGRLTAPRSKMRGYGRRCAKVHGWPY